MMAQFTFLVGGVRRSIALYTYNFLLVCILCLVLAILMTQFSSSADASEDLTILNWNIGAMNSNNGPTLERRRYRMNRLAHVFKEQAVDIATVQEFSLKYPDLQYINEELAAISYPMHVDVAGYSENNPSTALLVFSRFPLDFQSKRVAYIKKSQGDRSAQSIRAVGTPIGMIRISNIHTHIDMPCRNMIDSLNFFSQFDYTRTLLAGDANITFTNFYGSPEQLSKPECRGYDWTKISNVCSEATYDCRPNDAACRNSSGCFGDYFYLPNPSELVIKTNITIGNAYGISDSHPAIVAKIGLRNPPTPIPTPPPPSQLVVSCLTDRSIDARMTGIFRWQGMSGMDRYILRIHSPKTCTNQAGETIEWLCPDTQTPENGDRFVNVSAQTNCDPTSQPCTIHLPMADALAYQGWSVQGVQRVNGTEVLSEQINNGTTGEFTAFGCDSADLNGDGSVNQTDYQQLVSHFNTNTCASNIVGACPNQSGAAITIQDFNQLVGRVRAQ